MGADELQAFVKGVMAASRLTVSDVARMTGISRVTLTAITKGRYPMASEKTRETLERLADGLKVPRAEVFDAAGLDPVGPAPVSTVPAELLSRVVEAEQKLAEELAALRAALEAGGHPMPPLPERPTEPGNPRTPRRRPPENGPPGSRHKGSRGK